MTSGLGLAGATTTGCCCLIGEASALPNLGAAVALGLAAAFLFVTAAGVGLLFLSAAAGLAFLALAAAGFWGLTATAERAGGFVDLAAFLSGAAGRLLVRALPTEVRDAFDDFAIVRRRRTR
jgi:hypothetical protein